MSELTHDDLTNDLEALQLNHKSFTVGGNWEALQALRELIGVTEFLNGHF